MVSIQCSYTVTPSEPTPIRKLFSLCEQIKLRTHGPLLFVYKPNTSPSLSPPSSSPPPPSSWPLKSSNLVVKTLRDSLSKALSIYYPLAGRLSLIEGSRLWELNCNAKGALLLEARCETACLDDLGDFAPTNLVSQLIPNINYGCPIDETPLLAVQLTRFPCGSFTIGVALCRASIDGAGTMMFLKAWAKLARGDGLDLKTDFPNHDRSLLDSRRLNCSKKTMLQSRSEFCAPPPWLGRLEEGENRVVAEIVKLNGEQVKKLRMKAMINSNDSSNRRYSTFEVIAGHLWRCASKARYEPGNGDQPTRLSTLVNVRNRLNPPLPSSFSGNAAFPTVTTPTCTFNYLIQNPLSFAAKKVKGSIETVNDEYVRSCLDYIATERNKIDSVRYNFHYPAKSVIGDDDVGGGLKGKNPNLFVVSWMNFSFKDVDFGLGEPVYFGPGFMDSEGKAFVMNNANGDGLIVAICLSASHMDRFRRFFYEDVEEVVPSSKL